MHMVFALLCFVVVIHWLISPYPSGLLYWHCGNLTIAPVPAKQPWWIWINTSYEFIMNDCITTTKQSTTKPGAYFLGYTVVLWKVSFGDSITSCAHTARQLATYFWPKTNQRSTVPHHVQWQGGWFKAVFVLTMATHSITNADWLTLLRFNPNDHYGCQITMRHGHYGHGGCESK